MPVPVHKALPTLRFGTCVHAVGTGQLGAVTTKDVTSPQLVVDVKVALPDDTVTALPLTVPLLVVTVALLLKVTVYPEPVPLQVMFCTVNTGFEQITLCIIEADVFTGWVQPNGIVLFFEVNTTL